MYVVLGLQYLSEMSLKAKSNLLRMDIESYNNDIINSVHDNFRVQPASTNYILDIGNYIKGQGCKLVSC